MCKHFLFAAPAATLLQHFGSVGSMSLILGDYQCDEILVELSQLSVFFFLAAHTKHCKEVSLRVTSPKPLSTH